jgi:hypothetical protein
MATIQLLSVSPAARHTKERTFRKQILSQIQKSTYLESGTLGTIAGALGAFLGFV